MEMPGIDPWHFLSPKMRLIETRFPCTALLRSVFLHLETEAGFHVPEQQTRVNRLVDNNFPTGNGEVVQTFRRDARSGRCLIETACGARFEGRRQRAD